MANKSFTAAEVAQHNTPSDLWVIVRDKVLDLTSFAKFHPGGTKVLYPYAGKDATKVFESLHHDKVLVKYAPKLQVGTLSSYQAPRPSRSYGEGIPFGDPYWYQGFKSPYYNDSHKKFRDTVRRFVDNEIIPYVSQWDESGTYPPSLHKKAYEAGVLGAMWPREYGGTPPENCDMFHDLILWDELGRTCWGGGIAAIFVSMSIALPPILSVGSPYIKDKVCRSVITGEKIICLAISEPWVGSDVANLRTEARSEGDFYIVNGEKKFITSGCKADYFVVACRTGPKGMGGISLLLLEKGMPGLNARRMKTMGWWSSNTAYLTFEDVKVPKKNLIGVENAGFLPIMYQFNHERFMGMVGSNRGARMCMEEAIKYARQRKTFGKRLLDHQVIRNKIGEMARQIETNHAMIEQVAFQMQNKVPERRLGALTAMIKVQCTKTLDFCAREACQIFGGSSYIRGGVGERVERINREVRVNAIGGGSEEIMIDMAMRASKL